MNLLNLLEQYNIKLKGIILCSINEQSSIIEQCAEDGRISENSHRILFFQPHPILFERMLGHYENNSSVNIVQSLLSEKQSTLTLYMASIHHHSSLLPYKLYQNIYPNIKITAEKEIPAQAINCVFEQNKLDINHYNILWIDLNGGEKESLASTLLISDNIEAIIVAVYKVEMFANIASCDDIDKQMQDLFWIKSTTIESDIPDKFYAIYTRNHNALQIHAKETAYQQEIAQLRQNSEIKQAELNQQLNDAQSDLKLTTEKLQLEVKAKQTLEQQNKELQQSFEKKQAELSQQLNDVQSDLKQTTEKLQLEVKAKQTLEQQNKELQQSSEKKQAELSQQLNDVQSDLKQTTEKLQLEVKAKQTLEQQNKELQQKVNHQEKQLQDSKADVEKISAQFYQNEDNLKLLEIQFDELLADHVACDYELQEIKKHFRELPEQTDKIKDSEIKTPLGDEK